MIKYKPIFVIFISAILSACAETTPRFEAEFGNATRATLQSQIIHPEAGNNPDTVTGIDGQAARDALYNYQKSFIKPEPTLNTLTTNIDNN
ncbi:MAG TPA: tRNA dimethylallyltransferase [Methylophilaceae bacterium]|nr:tRNA dimethylallyltransferase [Methylophilaceae bacterium]